MHVPPFVANLILNWSASTGVQLATLGLFMPDSNSSDANVAAALRLFPRWLRDHLIASLLSIAGTVGALQSIITIFKIPQAYFPAILLALLFFGVALFCLWLASDPKRVISASERTNNSTETPPKKPGPRSLFSPSVRRLAMLVLPADIILGALVVIAASPRTPHPISAMRKFIGNIDSARTNLKSDSTAMTLYDSYRDARAKAHGEAFWTDVDLAMAVGVANVSDHNHQLQSRISGHIVPQELTTDSAHTTASFAWIGNKQIESDLSLLTEHFIQADQTSDRVDAFRRGNLGDYESAKQFNQLICAYWALVLDDSIPGLAENDPEKLKHAEQDVRNWLKNKE
jgi:hypothetical protein